MKRLIAIFLFALFILQAIPVTYLLAASKSTSCTTVLDEDKPDESKAKKDVKEYLSVPLTAVYRTFRSVHYCTQLVHTLPSPYLESFTPPPNHTC